MIEVYNVGQGDSFLLKPNGNCSFSNNPILIDCGNADQNVYRKIKHTININNVLITHSDNDHIGGLEGVITNKNITKLYVPYYLPEIIAVLNYFEKKSSRKIKPLLESIMNKINIHMLKEGDPLCSHIVILNPAIEHDIFKNISVSNQELQQAIENLNQTLNISLDEKEILEYESDVLQYLDTNTKGEYQENSKAFVHKFIYRLNLMQINLV
jgi:beta-lactamase superfamily II metal-dependent hydrolase